MGRCRSEIWFRKPAHHVNYIERNTNALGAAPVSRAGSGYIEVEIGRVGWDVQQHTKMWKEGICCLAIDSKRYGDVSLLG